MSDDNINSIRNKCNSAASAIEKDPVICPVTINNHANAVCNMLSEPDAIKIRRYYSSTIRLNITLREPNDHSCSVFDYAKLLSQEKSNRKREREKYRQPRNEADDPTALNDDMEEEIKRLAQHFEQKYGSGANAVSSKRKKKKKAPTFYNYTELAHGYDESDSFIDNSEAFDEALPDEMETYHGGYYVNCGQLKFKKVATTATHATTFASADENSDTEEIPNVKKRQPTLKSSDEGSDNKEDSTESSEQSESEGEESNATVTETEGVHASIKRKSTFEENAATGSCKRVELSSNRLGSEVVYDVNGDNENEDDSSRAKHNGKLSYENHPIGPLLVSKITPLSAEERMLATKSASTSQVVNKIKRKYKKRNSTEQISLLSSQESASTTASANKAKKKMLTVKVLLEEKRIGDSNLSYASLINDANSNCIVGGGNGGSIVNARFEDDYVRNSISDVIESVVNAARNHSEDSRESNFSSSDTKSIDSRTSGDTEKENHTLDEIETSTNYAASDSAKKVVSSFKDRDNIKSVDFLSSLPIELQDIVSQIKLAAPRNTDSGSRSVFTSHLNSKLISLETKSRALNPTCKHLIYEHVANFLPCSKESLMKRAKRLLFEEEEERVIEFLKKLKSSVDRVMPLIIIDANAKNSKKKFIFDDETRDCLGNVISCHLNYLRKLKPKKDSFEQSLKKFINARVTPLWPEGWMSTDDLMKVIDSIGISYIRPKSKRNHVATPNSGAAVSKKSRIPSLPQNSIDSNSCIRASAGNKIVTTSITATTATTTSVTAVVTSTIASTTTAVTTASNTLPITNVTSKTTSSVTTPTATTTVTNEASWKSPYLEQMFATVIARAVSSSSTVTPKESSSPPKKSHSRQFSFSSVSPPLQSSSQQLSVTTGAEIFKIDSIIASSGKTKTEPQHHLLNHASQYNKHYSHKGVKRKTTSVNENRDVRSRLSTKEEKSIANMFQHCNGVDYVGRSDTNSRENSMVRINNAVSSSKNSVTISSVSGKPSSTSSLSSAIVSTSSTAISSTSTSKEKRSKNSSFEEAVLDLSPNKISVKNESKSDTSIDLASNESSSAHSNRVAIKHVSSIGEVKIIPTSAKRPSNNDVPVNDHVYWSSSNARKNNVEIKDGDATRSVNRIVSNANSNVKPPLSRKQRILQQESLTRASDSSNAPNSSLSTFIEKRPDAWSKMKDKEKSVTNVDEKRTAMVEETTTATDILSQIINDSLRETNSSSSNSSRFNNNVSNIMSTFKNCESDEPLVASSSNAKCEMTSKPPRDRAYRDKQHVEKRPHSSISPSHSMDVTVSGTRNTSNQAEIEAADVIKELLSLNQIGGHSIPRRMYYKDTNRFSVERNTNNSVTTSGASSNAESSLPIENSATVQRPVFSDFQSAFFQHLMKRESSDGNAPT